jgi:hypothetical protein
MLLVITDVSVGRAAILHNGVIDPVIFTKEDYNRPLCYLALEVYCL